MVFCQLMSRRYEHASTLLTSNKGFEEWGEIFGDEVMAAALIDRLVHHCHIVNIRAAATGVLRLPQQPVEVLIAASILVSAIHAVRPIFPGRESFVAGGFGLVHGLAFATMIAGLGADTWQTARIILGFNVGIELMQLGIVVAVMPWLLAMARSPVYAFVRR